VNLPVLVISDFDETLAAHGLGELRAARPAALQVNVGKVCNQACKHCHVDAGPNRTESMSRETAEQVIEAVRRFHIATVDITGGAPELNPSFEHLVTESRRAGAHVMVRHNLTVQFVEGKQHLPEFFRDNRVEVIASLPYFLAQQTDAQRGAGVFDKSITALRRLNESGYGMEGTGLLLNLVYNPVGAFLPPNQESIERDFKHEMRARYEIAFNRLYTITNMPISRFLDYLRRSGNYERYMQKLVASFNPATVSGLMCRDLISVGWDGRLFDCDFNQMIELRLADGAPQTIKDFDLAALAGRRINTANHCYGCTAGSGSSCGGATAG
jgi:radical SAM/Cys-rich protein